MCRGLGFINYSVSLSGVCLTPGTLDVYIDEATPSTPQTGDTLYLLSDCTSPAPDGYYVVDPLNTGDIYVVSGSTGEIVDIQDCDAYLCRDIGVIQYSLISLVDVCDSPLSGNVAVAESYYGSPQMGDTVYTGTTCETVAPDGWYILDPPSPNNVYIVTGGYGKINAIDTCNSLCNNVTFDLSVTGETYCSPGSGSARVSNITGDTSGYTISWSNSFYTGDTLTGLSSNNYSVTITYDNDCTVTENFNIPLIPQVSVTNITTTQTECFDCDGQSIITITGGTPPYLFSGSNGQTGTTTGNTYTFSGLCAGLLSFEITDDSGCSTSSSTVINTSAGFSIVSVTTKESECIQGGAVSVEISAPAGVFTYTLTAQTTGNITTVVTSDQSYTFTNLPSDTYILGIEGTDSECFYTQSVVITNQSSFTLDVNVTDGVCDPTGGSVIVEISPTEDSPTYPVTYVLTNSDTDNIVFTSLNTVLSSQTITNLSSGNYSISVTDNNGCEYTETFIITNNRGISMTMNTTDCVLGNDGEIIVYISNGVGPFTLEWEPSITPVIPNPYGQNGLYLNGLSGGTYTLTVTDSVDCTLTQSAIIDCTRQIVNCYQIYTLCDSDFETTVGNKRDISSMLGETFNVLTSGQTDCILNSAVYIAQVEVTGSTIYSALTNSFYTGYTLNDVPSDEDWVTAIEELLDLFVDDEVASGYDINLSANTLSIFSNCESNPDPLSDANFKLSLEIDIDVSCVSPSPTPSITPTPTITPSITPTPTITPSITPTPTITPSITPTPTITPSITPTPTNPYQSIGEYYGLHAGSPDAGCDLFTGGYPPSTTYYSTVSQATFESCPIGVTIYSYSGSYTALGTGYIVNGNGCYFEITAGVVVAYSNCSGGGDCTGIGDGC